MQIFINFLTLPANGNFSLTLDPSDTIEIVKSKIEAERKIPKNLQRLIFMGDILEGKKNLSSYNIQNESILDLVLRFEEDLKLNIKTTNGSITTLDLQTHTLIEDIKLRVEGKEGFPSYSEKLPLFFAGIKLEEGNSLAFYKIKDGSTLFLDSVIRKKRQIFIITNSKIIKLDFKPSDTIYNIKCEFEKIEGVPTFLQCLKFKGEEMKNDRILESYGIKEGFSLRMDLCYQEIEIQKNHDKLLQKELENKLQKENEINLQKDNKIISQKDVEEDFEEDVRNVFKKISEAMSSDGFQEKTMIQISLKAWTGNSINFQS